MINGPAVGVDESVIAFEEWIASQLVSPVHHISLPPLRKRQNELGCEIGETGPIFRQLSHEQFWLPSLPPTHVCLPASHEFSWQSRASIRAYCGANESSRREAPRAHAWTAGSRLVSIRGCSYEEIWPGGALRQALALATEGLARLRRNRRR